jgi:hypothetical protein
MVALTLADLCNTSGDYSLSLRASANGFVNEIFRTYSLIAFTHFHFTPSVCATRSISIFICSSLLGIPALANTTIECCGIEGLCAAEETTHLSAVE